MLQIAVCDDDTEFSTELEYVLLQAFKNLGQTVSLTSFKDGRDLIDAVEKQGRIFDVIFLDVEMPAVGGFKTARRLRQIGGAFILIFITNWENQAREGCKYNAYRYIFKSSLQDEVSEAVSGIIDKTQMQSADEEYVSLKYRNLGVLETIELKKSDILYFKLEKTRIVTLKTVYSEYELLKKPLLEYKKQIENSSFCLLMRNYLLNFNRVADINRDFFVMEDGEKIPLGLTKETRKTSMEKYMQFAERRM